MVAPHQARERALVSLCAHHVVVHHCADSPYLLFSLVLLRRWAMEQEKRAQHLIHQFCIGRAQCTNEDDRAPVMANITSLLQNASCIGDGEDATDVFDAMVRLEVPEALKNSVGHVGVPFVSVLAAGAAPVDAIFDTTRADTAAGSTVRGAFPRWWYFVTVHFSFLPLFNVYASVATRGCVQLRGFVLPRVPRNVSARRFWLQFFFSYLRAASERSDAVLIIDVAGTLILSLVAHWCLQPHVRAKGKHSTTRRCIAALDPPSLLAGTVLP